MLDVLVGIMLGVAYVAAPGPVNIETLRRGLRGGVWAALALQVGSLAGHLLWAILALAGVGALLTHSVAQLWLGVVGTGLLIYLGWSTLRSSQELVVVAYPGVGVHPLGQPGAHSLRHCFWAGAAIATANPFALVFWVSVGGTMGRSGSQDPTTLLLGFFLGGLLMGVVVALLVGLWSRHISHRLVQLTARGCGLALIGCGLLVGLRLVLP
ncbi:MAG: LysE family transporter [Chloroflexales bacterium]|nr:LysE family transporter [Chloroflexales bacterium]